MSDLKEHVRNSNPIAEVIGDAVPLKKAGKSLVGLCPFHEDKSKPNFHVFPDTESFFCFACGIGGDVFSFVMKAERVGFAEALKHLAVRKGIAVAAGSYDPAKEERRRTVESVLREAALLYHKNLPPEVRRYLNEERGLTDETLERFLVGFCDGKAAFQAGRSALVEAGLAYESGKEFFEGFITFPHFVGGHCVYMSGRGWPEKAHKKLPKEKALLEHLYNEDALKDAPFVVLAEGEIDALTLLQAGFPACGVLGATSFKEEWVPKFEECQKVFLSFDVDEAGEKGNREAAELLGAAARLVRLPQGEDVNDFFKHGSAADYQKLMDGALGLIETKVKAIPAETPRTDLPALLNPILEEIALLEDTAYGDALLQSVIRDHFGLKGKEVASYEAVLKRLRKAEAKQAKEAEPVPQPLGQGELLEILRAEEGNREIRPAQDFKDGVMSFTVLIRQVPYLVTSQQRLISFEDAEREGMVLLDKEASLSRFSPVGIREFLEGRRVEIPELYARIHAYIRRFVFLTDSRAAFYLALWVMGTYVFSIFRYYPYVWLNAEKGSGKTLLMEVLASIAFNGELVTNPTEATLFRDVSGNMTSLFIDEVENLRRQDKETAGAVMAVLNTGFSKSGIVKRNVKREDGNYVVKPFSTYSPKVFAGINDISDVLRDRTVCIRLLKKKENEVAERYKESDEVLKLQQGIRDDLYIFALTHGAEIAALSREQEGTLQGLAHLANRELDIWEPVILLANVVDGLTKKDEVTPAMEALSKDSLAEKQEENVEQNETYKLLTVLKVMVGEVEAEQGEGTLTFASEAVFDYFKGTEEFSWLEKKNALTSRLKKVGVRSKQRREGRSRARVYVLDEAKFLDLCERFKISAPESTQVPS